MHIYAGSRIPWFEIDDGLSRYEGEAPAEPLPVPVPNGNSASEWGVIER